MSFFGQFISKPFRMFVHACSSACSQKPHIRTYADVGVPIQRSCHHCLCSTALRL